MVPLLLIYALAIQLAVLLFLYLIIAVLVRYRSRVIWIWAGAFVFELAAMRINGETSLRFLFEQGTDRVINLSFLLPNVLATFITLLLTTKLKKVKGAIRNR